jgi:hypothetical protein
MNPRAYFTFAHEALYLQKFYTFYNDIRNYFGGAHFTRTKWEIWLIFTVRLNHFYAKT